MLSGQKLSGYRFPLAVIGSAVWLYHRFTLSYRDVEELLLERGIVVTRESIRTWCINFSDLFALGLRHAVPGGISTLRCVDVGGVKHWLWRAVDERGAVMDVFLQEHRDTQAARSFFHRLLGEHDVPDVIHTDRLRSYGAALRELPVLHAVEHVQVVSTAPAVTIWSSSPTNPHGTVFGNNGGSGHENEHKVSSTCTPASRISTTRPALPFPLATVVITNRSPSRRGKKSCGRRSDLQTACLAEAPMLLGGQQLATTGGNGGTATGHGR